MGSGVNKARNDTVLYLYGISQSAQEPARTVIGVDGKATVDQLPCAGMVCWISRVAKSDFADNLSRNIENLEWLAEMTPRHQKALAAIAEVNDVLPARFGTVFLNEASLGADIENHKAVLLVDLKRIQGNEEWGVKVFAVRPEMAEVPEVRSGKGYLQAKSALLRARMPEKNDGEIARFAKELEEFSVATAEGGKISGGRRDLRYQVSLLLKRGEGKKLQAILKQFENEWKNTRHIECSGPWPPYSFVTRNFQ
jgi:Gas vesicle synthesis protein GvpL/GvpF